MLWGAGRLLLRAARFVRAEAGDRISSYRIRQTVARLALGLLVVTIAGGGNPFDRSSAGSSRHRGNVALAAGSPIEGSARRSSVSVWVPGRDSPGALRPTTTPDKRYALLVGINSAPGARHLEGAVTDARRVDEALLNYGFPRDHITMLLDGQATRTAILSGLDALARRTPADGVAVVVIAAHSRVKGGVNQLLAGDGARVNSTDIASRLQALKSPAWIALPTCYAAGYALPGIVGHNRIATFASSGNSPSYELGSAGSYLILNMVQRAMIEGHAPFSVESSFGWAQRYLARSSPYRVPLMSDGVDGELVLGDVTWARQLEAEAASATARRHRSGDSGQSQSVTSGAGTGTDGSSPPQQPQPTPPPRRYTVEVCSGRASFNCHG